MIPDSSFRGGENKAGQEISDKQKADLETKECRNPKGINKFVDISVYFGFTDDYTHWFVSIKIEF